MKTVQLSQILTNVEFNRARILYKQLKDTGTFASTLTEEIIAPNIERINKALGQENDPKFLAYAVEYVLSQGGAK